MVRPNHETRQLEASVSRTTQANELHQQQCSIPTETMRGGNFERNSACTHFPASADQDDETFFTFVRILFKYLHKKDIHIFHTAQRIVRESEEYHERGEAGLVSSVRSRLEAAVPTAYWDRAEFYFQQLLQRQQEQHQRDLKRGAQADENDGIVPSIRHTLQTIDERW